MPSMKSLSELNLHMVSLYFSSWQRKYGSRWALLVKWVMWSAANQSMSPGWLLNYKTIIVFFYSFCILREQGYLHNTSSGLWVMWPCGHQHWLWLFAGVKHAASTSTRGRSSTPAKRPSWTNCTWDFPSFVSTSNALDAWLRSRLRWGYLEPWLYLWY